LAAVLVGGLQAAGTAVYALALAFSTRHSSGWTIVGSRQAAAVSLVVEYVLYAGAIAAVTIGLARDRRWAFTPFLVIQAFLVIAVGSTLAQSGNPAYIPAGYAIIAIAVTAAVFAVLAQVRRRDNSSAAD
jgi:hypothetical protein